MRRAVLGLSLLAMPLLGSGCSGSSESLPHPHPSPIAVRSAGPELPAVALSHELRWLVPTTGAAPSVAAENQARGTRAWRLPGPAADVGGLAQGAVRGYATPETVSAGQTVRFAINAPGARRLRIAVFRMGWYRGTGGREVLRSRALRVLHQSPCVHVSQTGLTTCHWRTSLAVPIPAALASGVYVAKVTAPGSGQSDILFVVQATRPSPLLAMLGTSTYEAYNAWGGDSLYPGGGDRVGTTGTTQGVSVSYQRPYDSITGAGQFFARDVAMVRFLERYGIPVSYTTSEGVNADPGQLLHARALLDFGHSEYWSFPEVEGFAAARAHGVNLLFLSSDTMAWVVRYSGSTIVGYKEHGDLDPNHIAPTGAFSNAAELGLTGSEYLGCILRRIPAPGAPRYDLAPWRPNPQLQPAWLFAGTGLTAASTIPGIVGYELDAIAPNAPAGTTTVGGGTADCMGTEVGEPTPPPGPGQSTTTLFTAPSGAFVFSSGTLSWELGLEPVPSASPEAPLAPNPALVRMTLNVIHRALRPHH